MKEKKRRSRRRYLEERLTSNPIQSPLKIARKAFGAPESEKENEAMK
jgi:hypothetical protein